MHAQGILSVRHEAIITANAAVSALNEVIAQRSRKLGIPSIFASQISLDTANRNHEVGERCGLMVPLRRRR
jgi:hypothetical protein